MSRKRSISGMRNRNCLPAICQVGPTALLSNRLSGAVPRLIVTWGVRSAVLAISPGNSVSLAA
jgi:hypothetical protein